MKFSKHILIAFGLSSGLAAALPSGLETRQDQAPAAWPDTPFTTDGRNIKSKSGQNVVFAGINWPGAADTMIPEGLQYRSLTDIVSSVKSIGMNAIRLTYAIEMVDNQIENGPALGIGKALSLALGAEDGPKVLAQITKNNPTFVENTTQLEIFDAIAAECERQQIYLHLDNHVSKAEWCCSDGDTNAWFGSPDFDVEKWKRGLGFMADHAKKWKALTSMSLRNELRQGKDGAQPNTWGVWYDNMLPAAASIHANNSDPLIFFSGDGYDTNLAPIVNGEALDNGQTFNISQLEYANKVVFELHHYAPTDGHETCEQLTQGLVRAGYSAMDAQNADAKNRAPVVLSEFGFNLVDNTYLNANYAQCIRTFLTTLPGGPGSWMHWTLSGSYYRRQGKNDVEDPWGMTNRDWSAWRNPDAVEQYFKPFVTETLNPPK